MRRWIITGLAMALGSTMLARPTLRGADRSPRPEDALVNVASEWLRAEAGGDRAALDRLIADDFIGMASGGKIVTKGDIVPAEGGGEAHFPKTSLKETTARAFGNTGVVMGLATPDDPNQPGQFRFTLVCMKREQGWQIVAAHLAHAAPQQ